MATIETLVNSTNFQPISRGTLRCTNDFLDTFGIERKQIEPLSLPVVLQNVDALHGECNGRHVCGLESDFDLYWDYILPRRQFDAA